MEIKGKYLQQFCLKVLLLIKQGSYHYSSRSSLKALLPELKSNDLKLSCLMIFACDAIDRNLLWIAYFFVWKSHKLSTPALAQPIQNDPDFILPAVFALRVLTSV